MESKNIAKGNRAWAGIGSKASIVPNMELVTENVFVPITKVIFRRTREPMYRSKRKTQVVDACQCNSNVTTSLLKRPFHIPVKRYASAVSYSKQTNKSNDCEKGETMSRKVSRTINESSAFVNVRSETFTHRSVGKKRQTLLFPSSISDLPLQSRARRKSLSTREDPMKSNESDKGVRVDGTAAGGGKIAKSIAANFSKRNRSCKKAQWKKKPASGTHRLHDHSATMLRGTWNGPIPTAETETETETKTSTAIAPAHANAARCIARKNVEEQCPSVSDGELGWGRAGATANDRIGSKQLMNDREEIKVPVKRIESNTISRARSIAFHLSQSDRFFAREESSTLDNVVSEAGSSWDQDDHSILPLLARKQSQVGNDTEVREVREDRRPYRIKYSWQVIGTSSQTSRTLLESLVKENGYLDDESIYNCSVKYSWQIIGIATQTSIKDFTLPGCHSVVSFLPAKSNNVCRNAKATRDAPVVATVWRNGKKFIVLNNQYTQTFAHKDSQTIFTEFY